MEEVTLVVIRLSDAFGEFLADLARDQGAGVRFVDGAEAYVAGGDVAAVIVAAGGAEREALDWLDRHVACADVPCLAVGTDRGHRIAAQLVGRGASDYFALPDDFEILRNAVASAVARRRQALRRARREAAEGKVEAFAEIVGESPALKAALVRAARVLPHADATVLVTGETGTGKELLARAIHAGGARRRAPFVPVNCTALPAPLLESELFGHERGAFTDAHAAKPGLFEIAGGGTLFLDEIGDLAPELQAKLLRVLEDKQLRRVGGTSWRTMDVRIVAASNEDLEQAVRRGSFRQDLFFRLSVITLSLPPLRERGEDVILIADGLLKRLAAQHGLATPPLTPEVRRALLSYSWPGNVRELKNAVERALLLSPPGELRVQELLHGSSSTLASAGPIPYPAPLREITAAAARATLEMCEGNHSEAARRLGISRARLARLLKQERSGP